MGIHSKLFVIHSILFFRVVLNGSPSTQSYPTLAGALWQNISPPSSFAQALHYKFNKSSNQSTGTPSPSGSFLCYIQGGGPTPRESAVSVLYVLIQHYSIIPVKISPSCFERGSTFVSHGIFRLLFTFSTGGHLIVLFTSTPLCFLDIYQTVVYTGIVKVVIMLLNNTSEV